MRWHTDHRQKGYTLIEMTIALAIVGLMIMTVLPRISAGGGGIRTQTTLSELVETLRLARGKAIGSGHPVWVLVDAFQPAYRSMDQPWQHLPGSLHVSVTTLAADVLETHIVRITFWPDGSSSGAVINLVEGSNHQQIEVNWLTGRVKMTHAQ